MSVGENIKRLRETAIIRDNGGPGSKAISGANANGKTPARGKLTQDKLAELLGVSFQAVSAWERGEYLPDTANVIKLAEVLNVSASAILEDRPGTFRTKDAVYDWEHMKTFVKTTARACGLPETLRSVDYAEEKHKGQTRSNTDLPYISHPLTVACHALALGIRDDATVAACLLHDVPEDCKVPPEDLPFSPEVRELVRLLTHETLPRENRRPILDPYYSAIAGSPKAALIKCLDRCNNLTTISWGKSRADAYIIVTETEEYFPALLSALKSTLEYNDAYWLLKYQIESMLDIYKRMW